MQCLDKVEIHCKTDDYLPLSEIIEFQGGLKERTQQDIENLKDKIKEVGFAYPFFIWKSDQNYCIDGHGRKLALLSLEEEGYELPGEFPVVFVEAENEEIAKEKLLQAASSYGFVIIDGLAEFTDGLEIDLSNLSFTDAVLDFSGDVFTEKGDMNPAKNALKIATFGNYDIPVSEKEIELFKWRLDEYIHSTGGKAGFFKHYLVQIYP